VAVEQERLATLSVAATALFPELVLLAAAPAVPLVAVPAVASPALTLGAVAAAASAFTVKGPTGWDLLPIVPAAAVVLAALQVA
jgi:hypothetical protein